MIRRCMLALGAALGLALSVGALDVDETEVSSAQGAAIEFINYEGPHSVVESAESIRAIGRDLGRAVARGATRAGDVGRYSVIHAVDPAVPAGFDADIILVGEGARVDHIKNLRRIVAGYLEGAYAYSPKDADTLAIFITIYNAVYRGKLDYFSSKYKPVVTRELSAGTAGLSVRWDEWAGRSRIVVPLSARAGTGVLGSVDTTPITDKPTVESLKDESPTGGVAERMDVVDLKERGQEEERAAIAGERARVEAEEKALAEEKTRVAEERAAEAPKAPADAAKPAGDASATTGDAARAGVAGDAAKDEAGDTAKGDDQEATIAVSDRAKAEDAAIAEREAKLAEDKAALERREEAAAAKDTEIAADRAAIADDQKDAIKGEVAAAASREAAGTALFELVDPNQPFSRIALVDLKTGETIRKSALNTIRATTAVDLGDAYAAVAGQATGAAGTVRLVRVSKADYAQVTYGQDDLFADTPLWKIGSSLYAVLRQGDGWALGRFDPVTLELKATSGPVTRWTFLSEAGGRLVAQGPSGAFLLLDPAALTTSSELRR